MGNYKHSYLTNIIIGEVYYVYNNLGYGFLEKVYERALYNRLNKLGFNVYQQFPINVYFDEECVGEYYADIVVNNKIIIEVKAVETLHKIHEVQLVNYLKATSIEVGLLINFGSEIKVKRKVFSNDYYKSVV